MALRTCPECQSPISSDAEQCPKCGKPFKGNSERKSKSGIAFIGQLILAIVCLYVGGWQVRWQEKLFSSEPFVLESNGFAIGINDEYYGLRFHNRFFDSPIISWGLLCAVSGITPFFIIPIGGGHSVT